MITVTCNISGNLFQFAMSKDIELMTERDLIRSRDSVVGIATSYGLDDREVGVIFSSPNRPDRL
jgi:hypothetical protein